LSKVQLTILTALIPEYRGVVQSLVGGAAEKLRLLCGHNLRQGGHYAVTRSLVEGLKRIGANFNYNPVHKDHVGETVVVLADRGALEQAIAWKRDGRIGRLLAGPNLVVLPSDAPGLITAPEIDVYLVNSEWTYSAYLEAAPELERNCVIWAAGVDTEFWKPLFHSARDRRILIYQKNAPLALVDGCRRVVEKHGFTSVTLNYGEYDANRFLSELRMSHAAIFFSQSESQGIALAEAWAVNVPTMVWNPGWLAYDGKMLKSSSAPYLTEATGLFFTGLEDFERTFEEWKGKKDCFSPRVWVTDHMTDEICAMKLLKLAGIVV